MISRRTLMKSLSAFLVAPLAKWCPMAEKPSQPVGGGFAIQSTIPLSEFVVQWNDLTLRFGYNEPRTELAFKLMDNGQPHPIDEPDRHSVEMPGSPGIVIGDSKPNGTIWKS